MLPEGLHVTAGVLGCGATVCADECVLCSQPSIKFARDYFALHHAVMYPCVAAAQCGMKSAGHMPTLDFVAPGQVALRGVVLAMQEVSILDAAIAAGLDAVRVP